MSNGPGHNMVTGVPATGLLVEESIKVLGDLRDALSAAIASQSARQVRKAADLHKAFGLDRQLAWNIYRVATAAQPLDAGPFVPGNVPMERFLRAAESKGVDSALLADIRRAFEAFEDVVERHAGDRDTFESMIEHSDESRREIVDLKHKREGFRINGHLWGVQSRAVVLTEIIRPGAAAGKADIALIHGQVGVRQVRPNVSLQSTFRWKMFDASGRDTLDGPDEEPIDPSGVVAGGVNLLTDFCSRPLPEFRTQIDADGYGKAFLTSQGVGNCAAMDYFFGTLKRGARLLIPAQEKNSDYGLRMRRPTELLLVDFLVHRSLWSGPPPSVWVCAGDSTISDPQDIWSRDLLPIQEKSIDLGMGTTGLHTPDLPRYREMIDYTLNSLGWPADEFRLFRCRIEYPIMHSVIWLKFEHA